jgi:hypothetical protein
MGIKPTIEIMPKRSLSVPTRGNAVMVATPPQMVTVPAPLATPMTIWRRLTAAASKMCCVRSAFYSIMAMSIGPMRNWRMCR